MRFGSDLTLGMRRLKRGYDKKKNSDASNAQMAQGSGHGLGHSSSQARRLLPIVIEERQPDRLEVVDIHDGSHLVTKNIIRDD